MENVTVGTVVGGHELEALVGRGGMGVVYRARHVLLDRVVALKLLAPELAHDTEFRTRFERESRIAGALDHPNVVPVHDAGEDDGRLFITMRYVDGTDLREMVASRGGLPPELAAAIVAQVGSALDAAHAHGLVHRDVKPANVLVADSRAPLVYLTDFGLTKRSASSSGITGSGLMVGTLDYMSPEQFAGAADARTDVYALGCVLFEALTGRVPFPRGTAPETLWAHMSEPPPSVGGAAGEVFDPVIARALAKQPADRFPSTGDLGRAALAAAQGRSEAATERSVAVGEAAPGPTRVDIALPEKPPPGAATTLEPPARATAQGAGGATTLEPPARATAQGAGAAREDWWRQQPGPGGRRLPGWGWAAIAGGIAAMIAVVLVVALTASRESPQSEERASGKGPAPVASPPPTGGPVTGPRVWVTTAGTGLAALDPRTGRTTGTLPGIAGKIRDIAAGEGAVWVVDEAANTLVRVDARRGRVVKRIALPDHPDAVAVGPGTVWVTMTGGTVRIDPDTDRVIRSGEAGGYSLATQGGYLWATDFIDDAVNRISPSGEVRQIKRRLGGEPRLAAADARRVFVLTEGGNMLRLEQGAGRGAPRLTSVRTGASDNPGGLAVGEGGVWVADDRKLSRYDPKTLKRETRRNIDALAEDVATGAGAVWLTSFDDALVVRVNPRTGYESARYSIPAEGKQIAVSR
ncbi:MAG: protein kinase domain-containing protein [Solirubrobacteraceae bacterium]